MFDSRSAVGFFLRPIKITQTVARYNDTSEVRKWNRSNLDFFIGEMTYNI